MFREVDLKAFSIDELNWDDSDQTLASTRTLYAIVRDKALTCPSSISVRRETAGLFSCSRAWPATHSTARSKSESVCASVPKWRRLSLTMLALLNLATLLLRCTAAFFRSRNEQPIVELTLRQQLATYTLTGSKPNITPLDRAFWVALCRFRPRWKDTLVIVKPDAVIRWPRKGFRLYWRAFSKRGPGRPPISEELQALIRPLAGETYYNADRVHTRLRDAPGHRSVEVRPTLEARVIGSPRVGGLHHRYTWREAA